MQAFNDDYSILPPNQYAAWDSLYLFGLKPAHFPVPALASSSMCIALNWIENKDSELAWDGKWQEQDAFRFFYRY